jgi:hypothetical protein
MMRDEKQEGGKRREEGSCNVAHCLWARQRAQFPSECNREKGEKDIEKEIPFRLGCFVGSQLALGRELMFTEIRSQSCSRHLELLLGRATQYAFSEHGST